MESESLKILELPYAGNALSMIVLLPKEIDGLGTIGKSRLSQRENCDTIEGSNAESLDNRRRRGVFS